MASTHSDPMALRQSIEVPTDCAGGEINDTTEERPQSITFQEDENTIDMLEVGQPLSKDNCARDGEHNPKESTISLPSTDKVAGKTVAPFLARHIPESYAPQGIPSKSNDISDKDALRKNPNTKYCYRHRPDSKCRRTADEPTMENLQRDLATLTHADQQGISHVWSLFSAAPAKQRNLMLQGILAQCCFPQLSYLSTTVRDLIRIDFVSALPSEISFKILCYLDTTSLCKAAQVSQKWRQLADDDVVWHKMCEQHIDRKCQKCGWGLPLLERKLLRDWKRQQQLRGTGRGLNEWSPRLTPVPDQTQETELVTASSLNVSGKRTASIFGSYNLSSASSDSSKRQRLNVEDAVIAKPKFRPWKDVYKDRFRVGTNWKYGRYSTKVFKGHTNGVMCLQFDDNMLATGSYDATIKLWDIETGECLRTLVGHTSGVRTLQFDDTKLISGGLDHTVRVWNWRTGELLSTMHGHTGGVIGLHFDGNILASGSVDKTIRIWNFENKQVFVLPGGRNGHDNWVNSVKVDSASRTVFSASDDCTIRLWDLDTRQTIQLFEGHVGQVQQVALMPAEYEPDDFEAADDDAASSSGSASDSGPRSPGTTTNPSPFDSWPEERPRPARYIMTGALDSTVRLWNVDTGKCLKTFFGHVEGVWAVAADTLRVVSGAEDRLVKVWDARTGTCEKTYTGHAGAVTCIGLSDSKLITGGEDCEVRMQSFRSEDREQSFDGDAAGCSTRSTQ